MDKVKIATAFLTSKGLILILKRSSNVRTMRNKWAGISGYIELESSIDAAQREIEEETGIKRDRVRLVAEGNMIEVIDDENKVIWEVYPFLFDTDDTNIRLDKEHDEYRWIKAEDIINYETVPRLREALYNCLAKLSDARKIDK